VDEFDLIRRAVSDVASEDPEARGRALAALRAHMALADTERRTRRRSGIRWIATAAVFAVLVFVGQTVLVPWLGGRSAAARELRRLGGIALSRPALEPGDGYVYTRFEELRPELSKNVTNGVTYTIIVRDVLEIWRRTDGAETRRRTIKWARFPSEQDRVNWLRDRGTPPPRAGHVIEERFKAGELDAVDLRDLPKDPDELKPILESGQVIALGQGPPSLAETIGYLMDQGDAPPALRAAMFQIMADLPSVEIVDKATDPLGRTGVGIIVPDAAQTWEYIFDPDNSVLLTHGLSDGSSTQLTAWFAFTEAAVVDRVGERP
jgi:hypothetical protein